MSKSVMDYAKKIREHCEKTKCEECDLYWKGYKICALHDNVTPDKWMLPGSGETFAEVFLEKFPEADVCDDGMP